MPDTTQNLVMPYILPAQAQKHVTHNEALLVLDGVVQLCIEAVGQNDPPASFSDGQIWGIGPAPTGAWVGNVGALAMRAAGGWIYITPREGWRAWDRTTEAMRVYRNGGWGGLPLQQVDGLGIGTGFDATNRLAVVSPATLLTHDGAGHQLKINKAAAGDTASLLFQSNWSGRAEMGLSGSDAFAIKVSADGAAWADALLAAPGSGQITLPAGALVSAGSAAAPALGFAGDVDTGLFRPAADQIGAATGGVLRWLLGNSACQIDVPVTGLAVTQSDADVTAGRLMRTGAGPAQAFRRGNILGTVSHASGVPTGAVIERGGNANGEYVRFADGTQICVTVAQTVNVTTVAGSVFRGIGTATLWPAAFSAVPFVMHQSTDTTVTLWGGPQANNSATSAVPRLFASASVSGVQAWSLGIGRWF
ncbi:DUF2793 domain-containing protein [Pseudotabrizicola sp. 4114]|uniref:DUF2793 domain-containing protein n=1 Tax=Pseudotabrizicola sp. 4114 TaxID=2817731 RepID=UPI002860FEB8|nr:hypothetical protein [Pseudorhodobacter sp. 4114]